MRDDLAYQEEWREELIDGKVVAMAPSPVWNHMSAAGNIYNIFFNYLRGKRCTPIQDGFDLHLSEDNVFVPDFMVVCDPEKIKHNGVFGAPDLVVEVLSPGTMRNDRFRKKEVYARCGVREYWLVDPSNKVVEVYLNSEGEFELGDVYALLPDWELKKMSEAERAAQVTCFKCSLFDDLDIALEDIFYRTF